ncbi:MAG: TonB family protein [Elusimicrobia bacterium]|nr:TonB family protein [Elusimicrobiota bacterium]
MNRYLIYSSTLHGVLLGVISLALFWTEKPQVYYGFQFLGGQSGFGTGRLEPAPSPTASPVGRPAVTEPPLAEPPPVAEDPNRVAIPEKPEEKKVPEAPKNLPKKGGKKDGRGNSPLGHGDFQGAKTGPVGGVGTSLEIGGFGPGGGGGGAKQFPFKWYGELVYKRLWEAWDRTDAGTRECKVGFTLLKDGTVKAIKIKMSSGDSLFDMTAKHAVSAAAPFPPLPDGFKEKELPVLVRFRLQ